MAIRIGLGLADLPFSSPNAFWKWIDVCENSDVDSIWQTDRLSSSEPILESMSAMAALAGATQRLKFGMNVTSVVFREPLLLAKQCATIDYLSNGRLLPAFGIGSIRSKDWKATNMPTAGRGRRSNEALEIIHRLWHEDSVSFDGEFYHYDKARISPKPVQKNLPLWIGGSTKAAIERTARYGTGWLAGVESADEVRPVVAAIKAAVKEHNGHIADDHYGAGFAFRFGRWEDDIVERSSRAFAERLKKDPKTRFAVGDSADILTMLDAFVQAGCTKFVLRPIGGSDEEMLTQTRLLIREVLPEIDTRNAA